jgi:hypothetical protein
MEASFGIHAPRWASEAYLATIHATMLWMET